MSSHILFEKQKTFLNKNGYLTLKNIKTIKKNLSKFRMEASKSIKKEGVRGLCEGKKKYYKKDLGLQRVKN